MLLTGSQRQRSDTHPARRSCPNAAWDPDYSPGPATISTTKMLARCLDRRRISLRISFLLTLVSLVVPLLFGKCSRPNAMQHSSCRPQAETFPSHVPPRTVVCVVQSTATTSLAQSASDVHPPERMGLYELAKRADEDSADSTEADSDSTDKRVKTVDVKQCFWQSEIGESNTKPLT